MNKAGYILAGILVCLLVLPLAGQDLTEISTLDISESASVAAPANLVRIAFAVESNASEAGEAVRMNAEQTDALLKALKKAIGREDRLETSGYSLNPVYGRGNTQVTSGYRVRNTVTLTSKEVEKAGVFIDAATGAGANRIDSLSFAHDQAEKLKDQAAVKALEKAVKTAERLAAAAGMRVVRVVNIDYSSPGPGVRFSRAVLAETGAGAPTPIEAGELSVSATVRMTFEIRK
ncbi:MAG: SIMPL domain-containing protein [Candidatus Aminicenantaceae bacterium]